MTIFLVTSLVLFIAIMIFFADVIIKYDSADWLSWLAIVISTLIGVLGGYLAVKFEKLAFFAIGACGGWFLGMLLYTSILVHISNSEAMFYIPCSILAGILGIASFMIKDYLAILITSLLGSYLLVRSISIFAGGFPNEFILGDML